MSKKVCFVRHRYFGDHSRVVKQTTALVEAGFDVSLLCMKRPGEPAMSIEDGVQVHRVPAMERKRAGKIRYILEYLTFVITCFFYLTKLQFQYKYDVIKVHTLPDFLVFAALIPKLMGAKIIVDMHEPVPEQFHTKYGIKIDGFIYRVLVFIEQLSMRFSDYVVNVSTLMRDTYISRGADPRKMDIVLDAVDMNDFISPDLQPAEKAEGEFRLVMHGLITPRYGHDTVLRAIHSVREQIPNLRLKIFGDGPAVPDLRRTR